MSRLLFFENGQPPSSRSRRQLLAATEAGWDVTVVLREGHTIDDLPVKTVTVDHDLVHPLHAARRARRASLNDEMEQIRAELDHVRARRRTVVDLARRVRGARYLSAPLANRARARMEHLEQRAAFVIERQRVLAEIDRNPTPFGMPHTFGDLIRLEGFWIEAADRIAELEWDVAHAADLDALPAVVWAARARKRPVVFDSHEIFDLLTYLPPEQAGAWGMISRRFVPLADAVLTVSDGSAGALRARGARSVSVIPNYPIRGGAPPRTLRAALGLPRDVPIAVHSGTAPANRRPERAIAALAGITELHVAFVGAIEKEVVETLEAEARKHGAGSRIHFVDPVPLDQVAAFLSDGNVGLILYGADAGEYACITMPNKVYDYVAAGMPVVAGSGTGAADFVASHRIGGVFEPGMANSLTDSIRAVLTDDQIRANVEKLSPEMDWARVAPEYLRALDDLRSSQK